MPSTSLLITTERVERLVMCSVSLTSNVCDHAPCVCGSLLRCKLRLAIDVKVIYIYSHVQIALCMCRNLRTTTIVSNTPVVLLFFVSYASLVLTTIQIHYNNIRTLRQLDIKQQHHM
jgi:hypothetical protein